MPYFGILLMRTKIFCQKSEIGNDAENVGENAGRETKIPFENSKGVY
jgi:hypothetical protein